MSTFTLTTTATVKDANGATVGSLVTGTETYTGGDFVVSQVSIATGQSDVQLDLGNLSSGVTRMFVKSDYAVTLEIGGTTGVDARSIPAGGAVTYQGAAETEFYITNASGSTATITYYGVEAP